ncbi:hypothetical protein LCGC14_0464860 [marine sediment metagenome]|uniref:Uncharacterized protein n=1 Tax=marine sediment metagenome TaxID=412755 RepID=A0A0F9SJA4_9ZZZZ
MLINVNGENMKMGWEKEIERKAIIWQRRAEEMKDSNFFILCLMISDEYWDLLYYLRKTMVKK